nr:hypothetical protein BaRGS_027800 [Batillaria attramentaria]
MTDSLYEELVARFAGPATVVKIFCKREPRLVVTDIRTAGQFISEVGDRNISSGFVAVSGTGKTLTAVIMGVEWMRRNKTVDILSGDRKSRAAASSHKAAAGGDGPAGQGGNSSSSSTTALQYRDVFVLLWGDLHDDVRDDAVHVTRPADSMVRGLRQAGVPI